MEHLSHFWCTLIKLRKWFCNKANCIPMGIKNAKKNRGGGGGKNQTIENDVLLEF